METICPSELEIQQSLITTAESLFKDDPLTWPLHSSLYYLGQIPSLTNILASNTAKLPELQERRLRANLSADWHTASIQLAGRIFGDFQKRMAVANNCPRREQSIPVHTFLTADR